MRLCLPGTNFFSRVRPLYTIQPLSSRDYQHSGGETETYRYIFLCFIFCLQLKCEKRRGNKEDHYLVLSKMTILKDANKEFLSTTKNTLHDHSTFLVFYSVVLNLQSKEENQRFTSLIARFILEQRSPNTPKTVHACHDNRSFSLLFQNLLRLLFLFSICPCQSLAIRPWWWTSSKNFVVSWRSSHVLMQRERSLTGKCYVRRCVANVFQDNLLNMEKVVCYSFLRQ